MTPDTQPRLDLGELLQAARAAESASEAARTAFLESLWVFCQHAASRSLIGDSVRNYVQSGDVALTVAVDLAHQFISKPSNINTTQEIQNYARTSVRNAACSSLRPSARERAITSCATEPDATIADPGERPSGLAQQAEMASGFDLLQEVKRQHLDPTNAIVWEWANRLAEDARSDRCDRVALAAAVNQALREARIDLELSPDACWMRLERTRKELGRLLEAAWRERRRQK